jgi:hypothetical protein
MSNEIINQYVACSPRALHSALLLTLSGFLTAHTSAKLYYVKCNKTQAEILCLISLRKFHLPSKCTNLMFVRMLKLASRKSFSGRRCLSSISRVCAFRGRAPRGTHQGRHCGARSQKFSSVCGRSQKLANCCC